MIKVFLGIGQSIIKCNFTKCSNILILLQYANLGCK